MKTKTMIIGLLGAVALSVTAQTDEDEKNGLADRLFKVMNLDIDPLELGYVIVPPERGGEATAANKPKPEGQIINGTPLYTEARAMIALRYAEVNGIPLEAVIETAKSQIRLSCASLESGEPNIPRGETTKCERMLAVLAAAGDLSSLPFLEEVSFRPSNEWVRKASARAYISLASTNSVPFLRKLTADNWYKRDNFTSPLLHFLQMLTKTPNINEESLVFLCEFVERNDFARNVSDVDKTLCEILPGYSNSVQRLAVARRQLEDDNVQGKGFFAERWTPIKAEIENVPETQRKDFRAKGELLDPDRKKEP
ncbi:MAG: hypothetical protein FWH21_05125 [Kiritimatiellaeota bacterium]|nr:hypothetical protein [Kiritimatiellota bacterium]